ncbi:MAG: glycosyltransferase family 4 protein, partial [Pseudomonadota bacterium]
HWCHDLYPDLLPYVGLKLPAPLMQSLKKSTRRSMKKCDKVVTIGRCMAKQLTHSGVEPSRVAVIPNWPDYEILDPSKAGSDYKPFQLTNPDVARPSDQQVRDDSPKFRILYAGNLGRMHPIQSLLDAAYFMQDRPEMEFCFVGDGPNYDRLAQERSKRGIENIRLLPYQPAKRLRYVMESGDIHIVSLKEDAGGLLVPCKFYAALAVGRPVIFIGPEDCEISQVIKDFGAGTVVPPRDAARLIETITEYRMNSDLWFAHQAGAIEAGKVFTPDQSITAWIKRAQEALVMPL